MTVKTGKRGRPSHLNAERIVECARAMLAEQGKIPSIRALSAALSVDPMAIYHYFPNKAALLEAVCLALIEAIHHPAGQDWRTEIRTLCLSYLTLLQAHPGLLDTLLSMDGSGPAQVFIARYERALQPLALPQPVLNDSRDLLVDYLHGYALAMQTSQGKLDLSHLDGPLAFWIRALQREADAY
ncbi:TetR/AcrR family transcriptional regulator [Ferrimonas balearica]|uniref:TetR/AcrR family transcriptional regulator n=1 Tax=Ferrimonas balearica TaxID=44012 RepID=UPI001F42486F|nr:TetR/AcrR family transcriptional regulator [Ferrimonas balearica]MBY6096432.1 TetR/AcrR family transcriptional regulator [Ferrimonas balearica]